mgnify:CR=1 FL=1
MTELRAFRAELLDFTGDPGENPDSAHVRHRPDGLLLVADGRIVECGPAARLLPQLSPEVPVEYFPDRLLMPGFVDAHIHYPQTDIIASYGSDLLDWLQTYTYPAERAFADPAHAHEGDGATSPAHEVHQRPAGGHRRAMWRLRTQRHGPGGRRRLPRAAGESAAVARAHATAAETGRYPAACVSAGRAPTDEPIVPERRSPRRPGATTRLRPRGGGARVRPRAGDGGVGVGAGL